MQFILEISPLLPKKASLLISYKPHKPLSSEKPIPPKIRSLILTYLNNTYPNWQLNPYASGSISITTNEHYIQFDHTHYNPTPKKTTIPFTIDINHFLYHPSVYLLTLFNTNHLSTPFPLHVNPIPQLPDQYHQLLAHSFTIAHAETITILKLKPTNHQTHIQLKKFYNTIILTCSFTALQIHTLSSSTLIPKPP